MTIGLGLAVIGMVGCAMVGYLAGVMAYAARDTENVELLQSVYRDGWHAGKEWQRKHEVCSGEAQDG